MELRDRLHHGAGEYFPMVIENARISVWRDDSLPGAHHRDKTNSDYLSSEWKTRIDGHTTRSRWIAMWGQASRRGIRYLHDTVPR